LIHYYRVKMERNMDERLGLCGSFLQVVYKVEK